ncbi:glycosyltransferase [Priestia megaterium]|uniref:glycosyltransferase family 4 protein n=1 Tax=Priestia megaterium TaxID=1404 RepID=UPI002E1EBD9E|nr:glycosyltransferase [Priestia megaterium]
MPPKILLIGPIPPPIHGESMALKSILDSEQINNDIKIHVINTSKNSIESAGKLNISKLLIDFFNVLKVFKWCLKNQKQIIYISISQTKLGLMRDIVCILIGKIRKHAVITHLHGNNLGNTIDSFPELIRKIVIRNAFKKIDCGIVLGKGLEENYRSYVKNVKVVSNGVKENFIRDEEIFINKSNDDNSFEIVYLSNLMKDKGYIELIKAVTELLDEGYRITLSLAGAIQDSALFNDLMKKVKNKNYEESIRYLGIKKDQDKKKLLLESDVMILPTNYKIEGQPLSIIEGMAAGLPIISTKKGVIPQMIKNNGIILENLSVDNLKLAIMKIYKDPELRAQLSQNSRNTFKVKFTEKIYHNNLLEIFKSYYSK